MFHINPELMIAMRLNIIQRIRDYRRILIVARKPTKDEFFTAAKVSSIGILIVGALGFLIFLLFIGSCGMAGILC